MQQNLSVANKKHIQDFTYELLSPLPEVYKKISWFSISMTLEEWKKISKTETLGLSARQAMWQKQIQIK